MTRVLSIWLPTFTTDRLSRQTRRRAAVPPDGLPTLDADQPLATTLTVRGARRLAAVNIAAGTAGLSPGLPLADARAILPTLRVIEATPAADARALAALGRWCGRWTPLVAVDGVEPDGGGAGLWLDITGCAHLFGGEAALVGTIAARLSALGLTARIGLADTPGAAWAAARFLTGARALVPPGAQRQMLGGLPVAALRLPAATVETLARLGLRTIADLLTRPRAPLTRRLGPLLGQRLDHLLGHAPEPLTPLRPPPPDRVRMAFAEPIGRTEDVTVALDRLLRTMCDLMEARGRGLRALALSVVRVDGSTARTQVTTSRPSRDPRHLARLFRDHLESLDAGFGIDALILTATRSQPAIAAQETLAPVATEDAAISTASRDSLPRLIDRLVERCGVDNVVRLTAVASHRPDRAQGAHPAAAPLPEDITGWPPHQAPRPVRLLRYPQPVPEPPSASPLRLERIGGEWWRGPAGGETLDWLRVEQPDGTRLWLARDRHGWTRRGVFP